jgi:hypothetical protein
LISPENPHLRRGGTPATLDRATGRHREAIGGGGFGCASGQRRACRMVAMRPPPLMREQNPCL